MAFEGEEAEASSFSGVKEAEGDDGRIELGNTIFAGKTSPWLFLLEEDVGEMVGVGVLVGVGIFVGMGVWVGVGVRVGVGVGEGVAVGVGVGGTDAAPLLLKPWVDSERVAQSPPSGKRPKEILMPGSLV